MDMQLPVGMCRMETMNIEEEIDVALVRLGWPEGSFSKCDRDRATAVVRTVEDTFLTERRWQWWTALKKPFAVHDYPEGDGCLQIIEFVPAESTRCWFIPDTDSREWPVYGVEVGKVPLLLAELPYFEYYLVGLDFDWFVAENDHNEVVVKENNHGP